MDKVIVKETKAGKEVEKETNLEPVDNVNAHVLNAFCVPMTMDKIPRKCKDYMQQFKTNLITHLGIITVAPEAENFGFDEFLSEDATKSFPVASQIPYIVKHWRNVAAFVSVLKESTSGLIEEVEAEIRKDKKVTVPVALNKVEKIGEIEGVEDKDFFKSMYKIEFTAPMSELRATINALEASVENDKVFVVKQLTFDKVEDGVDNFENTLKTIDAAVKRGAQEYTSKGLLDPRKPESKEGYGWTIIGSDSVKATLIVECVSYVGNQIKPKK